MLLAGSTRFLSLRSAPGDEGAPGEPDCSPPPQRRAALLQAVLFAVCSPSAWKTLGCGSHAQRELPTCRPVTACYSSAQPARAPPTALPVSLLGRFPRRHGLPRHAGVSTPHAPGQPTHPLVAGLVQRPPGRREGSTSRASPANTPLPAPWSRRPRPLLNVRSQSPRPSPVRVPARFLLHFTCTAPPGGAVRFNQAKSYQ